LKLISKQLFCAPISVLEIVITRVRKRTQSAAAPRLLRANRMHDLAVEEGRIPMLVAALWWIFSARLRRTDILGCQANMLPYR